MGEENKTLKVRERGKNGKMRGKRKEENLTWWLVSVTSVLRMRQDCHKLEDRLG